ncbi:DUF551 domain-containing protein [Mesorhizobium sp. PUT5]|uniref:DUF551 domain-containing protein n=1 Tax=Mesorhizobium sp. PUT5 TaxID=3454629 RepID=UPI003FA4A8AA
MTKPTELDERALEAALGCYSEGGCSGLAEHERREVVASIIEAYLSALPASGGWQPIETAPKDGTKIQVWEAGYEWPEVIYYELYNDQVAAEVGESGYWRYADDLFADVAEVEFDALTHWMPLSSAPDRRATA